MTTWDLGLGTWDLELTLYEKRTRNIRFTRRVVYRLGDSQSEFFRPVEFAESGAPHRNLRYFQYRSGSGDYHGRNRSVGRFGFRAPRGSAFDFSGRMAASGGDCRAGGGRRDDISRPHKRIFNY